MIIKCPECGVRHDHRADCPKPGRNKAVRVPPVDDMDGPKFVSSVAGAVRHEDADISDSDPLVCPTCGHKRPLTPAEKQRNYRNRQKGKT